MHVAAASLCAETRRMRAVNSAFTSLTLCVCAQPKSHRSLDMATRVSAKCLVLGDKMYVGTHMHGPNHGLILYALLDVDCKCRCHNLCLRDHELDVCILSWQVW